MAILTKKDLASDTWAKLSAHLEAELAAAREQLESKLCTAEQTAHLRGDIARIKNLLALAKPDPASAPRSRIAGNEEDDASA